MVPKPVVKTVNIENIDGLSGVAGGDVGKAEASSSSKRLHDHRHRRRFRSGHARPDKEHALQNRSPLLTARGQ